MSKSWADESDFTEDEESSIEEDDEESSIEDEENEEDEENDEDNEENEDEENEEDEEYNEDEEVVEDNEDDIIEDEDFDEDDGIILVEEEPVKIKRKREYILNKKDIENQEKKYNYNNLSDEEFIKNIKDYLEQITTQKNSDILLKNILESCPTSSTKLNRKDIL